jgi:predicted RNase H-like HicB family nuclease
MSVRYAVVIEKTAAGYSAYCPDVPGCVSTGDTTKATRENFRHALRERFHVLRSLGRAIPEPSVYVEALDAGAAVSRYVAIYAKTGTGYSAHVPDLPGCIATGRNHEQTKRRMAEAVEMHIAGMREDGEPIPEPAYIADWVEEKAT